MRLLFFRGLAYSLAYFIILIGGWSLIGASVPAVQVSYYTLYMLSLAGAFILAGWEILIEDNGEK